MDELNEKNELNGNVKISDEVVVTIASVAVSEIDGVSGTGTGIVEGIARKFSKKTTSGGIKVTMTEDAVSLDINVIMKYGVRIPEVAWNVQDAVKREVELMTGLSVERVNVRVVGIEVPQETVPEPEQDENIENITENE